MEAGTKMIETRYEIRDRLPDEAREIFTRLSRNVLSSEFNYLSTFCFDCGKWKLKPLSISNIAHQCSLCNKENPLFFMKNIKKVTDTKEIEFATRRDYFPDFVLLEKYITEKIPIERIISVILAVQYRESFIVCPLPEQRAVVYWL